MQENAKFEHITEVSRGAFCLILKAQCQGKTYALKALKPEYRQSKVHADLLLKEYSILSSMQHAGIVRVVAFRKVEDFGECMVMEWIDGITLKKWLATPQPRKERRRVAHELMDILKTVHEGDVVHRDLKPSNIMLTHEGTKVKLIDFGLSDSDSYAIYKQPAGTKHYTSPEQRHTRLTDVRNDIYSLGCLLADLHLGIAYAPTLRRCKATSEKRYTNIEEVQQAFSRVQAMGRVGIAIILLALIAGSVAVFFKPSPLPDPALYAAIDSLCRGVSHEQTRIDSVRHHIDSLKKNVELSQEKLEWQREREQLLLAITERAKAQMSAMMHYNLDTLYDKAACMEVFHAHAKRLEHFAYSDEWAAPHNLSDAEKAGIRRELYWIHRMALLRPLQKRAMELQKADEAPK